MGSLGIMELIIIVFVLVFTFFPIIAVWKIVEKAGYPPAMSLLGVIPILNLVMLFIFAFSEWPIEKELKNKNN